MEDVGELLGNDSFEVADVLSQFEVDALVLLAEVEDPSGHSVMDLPA